MDRATLSLVIAIVALLGPAIALANHFRDRPKLTLRFAKGKDEDFVQEKTNISGENAFAVQVVNEGRRPASITRTRPLSLVVDDLSKNDLRSGIFRALGKAHVISEAVPLDFNPYEPIEPHTATSYNYPADGILKEAQYFVILISRSYWRLQIVGGAFSGRDFRCVGIRVNDNFRRTKTYKLPKKLADWLNEREILPGGAATDKPRGPGGG